MSVESVKAFIKHISNPDNRELLKSLDAMSAQEIPAVAKKYGFEFGVQDLVTTVDDVKTQHFAKEPTVVECRFLSAVANSKGWSCQ